MLVYESASDTAKGPQNIWHFTVQFLFAKQMNTVNEQSLTSKYISSVLLEGTNEKNMLTTSIKRHDDADYYDLVYCKFNLLF